MYDANDHYRGESQIRETQSSIRTNETECSKSTKAVCHLFVERLPAEAGVQREPELRHHQRDVLVERVVDLRETIIAELR